MTQLSKFLLTNQRKLAAGAIGIGTFVIGASLVTSSRKGKDEPAAVDKSGDKKPEGDKLSSGTKNSKSSNGGMPPAYAAYYKDGMSIKNEFVVPWNRNWDARQHDAAAADGQTPAAAKPNVSEEKRASPAAQNGSRHLYFVRHGQFHWGAQPEDRVLTDLGKRQAEVTGKRLKELSLNYEAFVNSTKVRAAQTADIIFSELAREDLKRKPEPMLEEGFPYPSEPLVYHWTPAPKDVFADGARIEAAFRRYFHRPAKGVSSSHELYICHSNVIRYFVCRALQLPPEAWSRFQLANGSITHVVIRPSGNVSIRTLGDTSHLPAEMVTFN